MPTFISKYNFTNTWSTDSDVSTVTSTGSITLDVNYTIVVVTSVQNYSVADGIINIPYITDNFNLTWSKHVEMVNDQYCPIVVWSYTADKRINGLVVSLNYNGVSGFGINYGGDALVWAEAGGVASNEVSQIGTATSVTLTLNTYENYSAILCYFIDWIPNTAGSRVWGTINGITPTTANGYDLTYESLSNYMIAGAYWPDVGFAGSKSVSFNHTNTHKYSMFALEILGSPFSGTIFPAPDTIPRLIATVSLSNLTTLTF